MNTIHPVEKRSPKTNLVRGILLTLAACGMDFLIVALVLRPKVQSSELIPVSRASENLLLAFEQGFVPFLYPLGLLGLFALSLKKDFPARMFFTLEGKWQRITALLLGAAIGGIAVTCLIVKADRAAVLYSLIYYTVFIGFAEEFVCRDVCTDFLRDAKWPVRYLVPNLCFALLHLFQRTGWGAVGGADLLRFLTRDVLGLAAGGCLFQLLKEKSGSIWLPVLLHALMDFSVVITY